MQLILSDYIDAGICLVYLDDLIIMGDAPDELQANIRLILARLDKYQLRIAIYRYKSEARFHPKFFLE